jgi:hypothetical protein
MTAFKSGIIDTDFGAAQVVVQVPDDLTLDNVANITATTRDE